MLLMKITRIGVIGQVQSSVNKIVTINFEHVGKKVINIDKVSLKIVKLK